MLSVWFGHELSAPYPNPFRVQTTIVFELPESAFITLTVYDVLGRAVATLVDELKQAGRYELTFDASRFPSGVYLYRIEAGDFTATRRMLLVK